MQRRDFITLLGAAAAWPLAARAQQRRRIGALMSVVRDDPSGPDEEKTLREALAALGWVEGRNIDIEFRWSGSDIERAQAFAGELVELKPDVLLSRSSPTTAALKRETHTIPIVFVGVIAPVEQSFVQSLAQPGGNITGFVNFEASIAGKWLQLLKEVDPRIARVAVVYNPQTAPFGGEMLRAAQEAAPGLSMEAMALPVQSDAEIETAMAEFARRSGGGLIAIPDSFNTQHRETIIAQARRNRLPALYANILSTPIGGLVAYSVDFHDLLRRAAGYVDRILKGARPADLPVQQPERFELSLNLKTARALGLEIPARLVAIADEVIE
jgi:putative tryptophan/tyrosine transport system substrate-binding protein